MGGRESTLGDDITKQEFVSKVGIAGHQQAIVDEIWNNFRTAARDCKGAKERFGAGVSVKGIIANVSGMGGLILRGTYCASGKPWTDDSLTRPLGIVPPLGATPFFHGKKDHVAHGTAAGFCYEIFDAASRKYTGVMINVAWQNPYMGKSSFIVKMSRANELESLVAQCQREKKTELIASSDVQDAVVEAELWSDGPSTAYLVVAIKLTRLSDVMKTREL